jgi:hypothetical protein
MGRLWGRLYAGTRNHRKIKILAERLPSLWTYWYVLIDLAIEVNDHGWIHISPGIPYSYKELAKELRIRRVDHAKILCRTLEELKMITISDKGILLNSFSERNFESDISTPRVRKYREKKKEATKIQADMKRFSNVTETDQNRTDTEHKLIRRKEASGGSTAPYPSDPRITPAKVFHLWNDLGCRPSLAELTSERNKRLTARIRKRGDPVWWEQLFLKAKAANRPWLTFDFLIANDTNAIKLLEGNYDQDFGSKKNGGRRQASPGIHQKRNPADHGKFAARSKIIYTDREDD